MASSRYFFIISSIVYSACALGIGAFGIILFLRLANLTSLRDPNHFVTDYSIKWVEVAPWLFVGVAIVLVGFCAVGIVAAKGSKKPIRVYAAGLILTALAFAVSATLVLVFVEREETDLFIADVTQDVFMHTKNSRYVKEHFSYVERDNHCCGATGPRQYRSGYTQFPASCCTMENIEGCPFSDPDVNEKKGCSEIVSLKTRIGYKYMAAASITLAVLELIGAIWALKLSRKSGHKKTIVQPSESEKVLL